MRFDLRCSLLAKVTALFLVVLLGLAALFSVGGLAIGYEYGFYREEDLAFEDTELFQDAAWGIAFETLAGYMQYGDPYSYVLGIGIQVEIRDADTGDVLFSDREGPCRSTVTHTFPASDFGGFGSAAIGADDTGVLAPPAPAERNFRPRNTAAAGRNSWICPTSPMARTPSATWRRPTA